MPKRAKYVPKHRHVPEATLVDAPKKALRTTLMLSSVAVAATGVAVSGGVLSAPGSISTAAAGVGATTVKPLSDEQLAERAADAPTSRSEDRRDAADPTKEAALKQSDGPAITRTVDLSQQDPRDIAMALLPEFGFSTSQFGCLDSLYTGESGWRVDADNPSSSAYGIPQALPGSKMASAGADWATNPVTQIRWGLGYIQDRYGSPCGAQAFKSSHGWY
ncbi:lytic transglycosylase domain-containing protein [Nocardioides sp. KIGAM211]|uniref:Lytic transglycosylase domain-containing protein n=1 Tax=Nocardioides luti TaxID=2761101 RepID=A0A7X0RET1_9ACTN|nr:lytic transglycosylase domain-containing protein [Nocardioides luti]MBB6626986.1 lytic transglycosylase domain-containing protein [Nocardioides luti]